RRRGETPDGAEQTGDVHLFRAVDDEHDAAMILGYVDWAGAERHVELAYSTRVAAAGRQRRHPIPRHQSNGDEERYPGRIASFSKSLPHDELGQVDLQAYEEMKRAVLFADLTALKSLKLGGVGRLANPQAAHAFSLEGLDSRQTRLPPPPAFASEAIAAEAAELYWRALLRDVPFNDYDSSSVIGDASKDLSRFRELDAPRERESITPATIFRGTAPGELQGPHVSQFLWKEISFGPMQMFQKLRTYFAAIDYLTTYDEWLAIQNGAAARKAQLGTHRYIRNGRDLAAYVQTDFSYQAFVNAALILFAMQGTTDARKSYRGAPYDAGNPYRDIATESTFVTFGQAHVLDLVARVTSSALKAAWYHKWIVHRRLRPEEFGGRVHNHQKGLAEYPIHQALLKSEALDRTNEKHGSWLLPLAYPEGAPSHPAYPAGHAAIAGACVTVLKAFFDEDYPVDDPVVAASDGLSLMPYRGLALMIGGELNKLASNIAFGRDMAGLHWRSDGIAGLRLGEEVALSVLADHRLTYPERFEGWTLRRFDGEKVVV
ncbi:MAG: vanadium-dependent haloperoxidase, partial [Acidobacteria bacterium]|nr:vanadium-dependent haloperoxidase [Acidobacteriota bacterium]